MPNLAALPDSQSISAAWIGAVRHLRANHRNCYNLIYSIDEPGRATVADLELYARYDALASASGIGSTTTVANTIFPLDAYRKWKSPEFYQRYEKEVLPQVKTAWGTYFDRMTRRRGPNGVLLMDRHGNVLNPLASVVGKLSERIREGRGTKTHYEMAVADEGFELTTYLPERDHILQRGGPCLSHVSFKLDDNAALRMTAFYRSHFYLQRALGNLLGLARLQAFVAVESGASIGPLTCIASHAVLESNLENAPDNAVAKFLAESGV